MSTIALCFLLQDECICSEHTAAYWVLSLLEILFPFSICSDVFIQASDWISYQPWRGQRSGSKFDAIVDMIELVIEQDLSALLDFNSWVIWQLYSVMLDMGCCAAGANCSFLSCKSYDVITSCRLGHSRQTMTHNNYIVRSFCTKHGVRQLYGPYIRADAVLAKNYFTNTPIYPLPLVISRFLYFLPRIQCGVSRIVSSTLLLS